jgi:hypothetical protein
MFINALWSADTVLIVVLLIRLGYLGLYKRYPFLMAFLALGPIGLIIGLAAGRTSILYYWSYMVFENFLGNALRILMAREMFSELYATNPGLRGITRRTLNRSILAGAGVAVALGPIVLVHRGDPGFTCWYLAFFEVHRCVLFGVLVFVGAMWRKLCYLPLPLSSNIQVYTKGVGWLCASNGTLETLVMLVHRPEVSELCIIALLCSELVVHGYLLFRMRRPEPMLYPDGSLGDPMLVSELQRVGLLFGKIDEAAGRAAALTVARKCPRVLLAGLALNKRSDGARRGAELLCRRVLNRVFVLVTAGLRPEDLAHKE